MTFDQFITQANQYGKARTPFLFVIDFEQKKPLIIPLEKAQQAGVQYDITFANQRLCNYNYSSEQAANLPLNIEFKSLPISFNAYQQAFHQVQYQLQRGNSYLLNLTFATPIQTNLSFEQIFANTSAKYKLWLKTGRQEGQKDEFICFSPECFVEITDNQIATYPMKGTISADIANAEQQLLNSQKEMQEHYTIVDLLRNDLSIVASDVKVERFRYVDKITTHKGEILQTSSQITGKLPKNWQDSIGTILANLLPAGSISGAPKQKTVEIIHQVEGQKAEGQNRGYYTGVFGLFLGDSLTSAVAIRYIEQCQNQLFFRSGGGITTQSDVAEEYEELLKKVYLPLIMPTSNLEK